MSFFVGTKHSHRRSLSSPDYKSDLFIAGENSAHPKTAIT
jgi:hypothetical protein